jgi:hypothetical protein
MGLANCGDNPNCEFVPGQPCDPIPGGPPCPDDLGPHCAPKVPSASQCELSGGSCRINSPDPCDAVGGNPVDLECEIASDVCCK